MVRGHSREPIDLESRTALLTRGLNIGFEAPHPLAELIVVAGLEAPDHPVNLLRFGDRPDPAQGRLVLRVPPAVPDVDAPIEASPTVDGRRRGWGLVSRPPHIRCAGGRRREND